MVRRQILKAKIFLKLEVLNKKKRVGNKIRFVLIIAFHPVFSKLKNVLCDIQLLLTPDREHWKAPIIVFTSTKHLMGILVKAKVTLWKRRMTVADHVGVLDAKHENMLWLPKHLDLSIPKENIALSPMTWTVVLAMLCIFFHAKYLQNNTQVALKVFNLDSTVTSQSIRISLKRLPSNKCR